MTKRAVKNHRGDFLTAFGELHAGIALAAEKEGKSVNEYGKEIFEAALHKET